VHLRDWTTRDFSIKKTGLRVGVGGWELGSERRRFGFPSSNGAMIKFFGVAEARAEAVSFPGGAVKDGPLRFCVVSCESAFAFL